MFIDTSFVEPPSDLNPPTSGIKLIPCSGKEASIPTLVKLAVSLPQFQRLFTTTSIHRSIELTSTSMKKPLTKLVPI